jgi:glycerol kinase
MSVILAIDQGTTSSRAILFECPSFRVLGVAQQELEQHYPQDGWVEHELEEIWYSVARTVREALRTAGIRGEHVRAIGITNQRETTALWNRATGQPVHRAIVWQDRRTSEFCQSIHHLEPMLQAKTGLVVDPYFSASKFRWLLHHHPDWHVQAQQGHLAGGTIDAFLIHRLTGLQHHRTDTTNASRTQLFNIHSLAWDDALLDLFEVPRELLPEVRPSAGDFGSTSGLDFLPDGIPIRGVAGDQQAALFGQGAQSPGEGKCTYGTGAFFLIHTGTQAVPSRHRLLTTIAAMVDDTPQYALEGGVFVAGAAVQWLRDGLHLFPHARDVEDLAKQSVGADPVLFVPGFVGLGAPHWKADARGAIFGLTRATTSADLARAALEGVAFQVAELLEAAEHDFPQLGHQPLRVDGGMSANDWFLQTQANLLGRDVQRSQQGEATALGAAFLASLGVGLMPSPAECHTTLIPGTRFAPVLTSSERVKLRDRWNRAIEAVIHFSGGNPG